MFRNHLKNEAEYDHDRMDRYLWQRERTTGLSRRQLIKMMAAALGSAAVGGFLCTKQARAGGGCVQKPTPPELFIPQGGGNYEMRFDVLPHHDYLVSSDRFFVRDHTCTPPPIDETTWRLRVHGAGVENPLELTYDDILALPSVTVTRFIECAGNGRSLFAIQQGRMAQGGQWLLGAVGVAEWTGVRLSDVLDLAGLKSQAVDVMPIGLDAKFQAFGHVRRPFPIEKALEDDTLLVYAMNGQPLLNDHGFPVRMLVPGWVGIANIKWVGQLLVSHKPLMSPFNTNLYRLFGDDYPPEGVLLTNQPVKSAFELPFPAQLGAGRHVLHGRSWSGTGPIQQVEVSVDGHHWKQAELVGANEPEAWVRWKILWNATPGKHVLRARATDQAGLTQPDDVPFNTLGYLFWAVVNHHVTVV